MNTSLKYFYSTLLFIGMMCSCFQFTIIQLSKTKKEVVSNLSAEEDIDDKEDTEQEKKEIEDDYLINHFRYSFYDVQTAKIELYIHEQKQLKRPALSIETPPPKSYFFI